MVVYDPRSLKIERANAAAAAQLGYTREDFRGLPFSSFVDTAERVDFVRRLRARSAGPHENRGHWRMRTHDGKDVDLEIRTIRAKRGNRRVGIGLLVNVSAQVRAEAKLHHARLRYRDLFRASPAPMWVYDADTLAFLAVNDAAIKHYGYTRDQFSAMTLRDIRPLEDAELYEAEVRRQKHAVVHHGEWRHRKSNGATIDVQVATGPIDWEDRRARVAVVTDVTEIKRLTEALATAERVARLGSWEYDAASDTLSWSDEMYELIGSYPTKNNVTSEMVWDHVHPLDREDVLRTVQASLEERRPFRVDHRVVRPDGETRWMQASGHFIFGPDGTVARIFGTALDITERKLAEQRLNTYALYDDLTILPNRLHMDWLIAQALFAADREGHEAAVLVLDLDRFKNINDALGHAVGDLLLQAVPDRLRRGLADTDIIGRLGGDTFIVTLPRTDGDAEVRAIGDALLRLMREPFNVRGHALRLTASIGISAYPKDEQSADGLIKSAEGAMFIAKESGRDRIQFAAPDQQARAIDRLKLELELSRALDRSEFVLLYQPIVDRRSGKIIAAEALLRWLHPDRGMVAPGQFIPLAEDTGLIIPIGEWVIGDAARQAQAWRGAGFGDLRVVVNISANHIRQEDFVLTLPRILGEAGADPESLVLEVTESTVMQVPQALDTVNALKALGLRLSIDDFGTGYSSLAKLRQFPFDIIKIDQSFVKELDVYDETIAKAVIAIGHSLQMSVIAEGVETAAQYARLRELGCDGMQGFYFSRPLPASGFGDLLLEAKRRQRGSR